MSIRVVTTTYGSAASHALHAAVVAAKAGEPLAPVTVVVPSNHVGVATRRLLASGRLGPVAGAGTGVAAITFLTVFRLAELLGAAALAASGRRPVSAPVLAAAMRAELAEDPGLFAPVADHPATEAALVATYRELRDLSPAALDALAATGPRAREVVRLHRAVRQRLAPAWSDEEDLLLAATAVLADLDPSELGAVIVHLPQRLTRHGGAFLAALADIVPTTVVLAQAGRPGADADVRLAAARLGLPEQPAPELALPVEVGRTTVVTASDADEEVRAAVRAVVDAARAGTRLDRIAVLHASPEPYARLAHEQLQAAGLQTNGAAVLPLASRLAGRTLLDLLELPRDDFRRQDVFAWLAAAPILHGGRWAPTTAWERLSREAAVVSGRGDWDHHLTRLAGILEERATRAAADDEEPEWKAEQLRRDAARTASLRSFVLGVIDDLARAGRGTRRWSEHAAWASRWLRRLLGDTANRSGWPPAEQRAAERVEQALDRLAALDSVEGPVALEVFARTLQVELEDDLGRVGRLGDGVLVGSVEMGTGLDLDLLVVLGLAEGSFPATVRDDSLLPDRERQVTGHELGLRADRVDRQHTQLVAALAGAARHLLCVPRGDLRRSADRMPSRWVLDVAGALSGSGPRWWSDDLLRGDAPWLRHVASFDAGLRQLAVPATEQEHRLRSLLAADGDLQASADATTARGAAVITARRSDRFTRFDGNLAGLAVPSPVDRPTSPTRLERWADCPHAHLVQDLLDAGPIENPEDALMITPLDKGTLVHEVLEHFIRSVLDRPEVERPAPGAPWSPEDRTILEQIGRAVCDRYEALGLTGRRLYWQRDKRRILDDLDRFLVEDSRHRVTAGTSPLAVELAFGMDGGGPAVGLDLPDGRTLRIRGKADRIDRALDGTIHVVDYKTGRSDPFRDLTEDEPVLAGTKLQLPVYGLAGRQHDGRPDAPVRAEYWFVTDRGDFERTGYVVTDAVLQKATDTIAEIVAGIEAGVFPARPSAGQSTAIYVECHVCDPDGLGTVELRQQWERKRHDPALERYAALAEPLAEEEP